MANGDGQKDFFNVVGMTENFRAVTKPDSTPEYWNAVSSLAIAQQLTVISGHLARISQALDEALNRAKQS